MDDHVGDDTTTILPYNAFKNVLLLGEADFSFARAFAKEFSQNKTNNDDCNCHDVEDSSSSINLEKQETGLISSSTITQQLKRQRQRMQITATEYGDGEDIANRYFNGDHHRVSDAMNSLLELDAMKEVICGLNARNLGQVDDRKKKNIFHRQNDNDDEKLNEHRANGQNLELGKETVVCPCQRWNVKLSKWDDVSPFWNNNDHWKKDNEENFHNQNYDLIIFNFPHSNQAGRATKLVKALFKQLRICIDDDGGRVAKHVILEMRLRTIKSDPTQRRNIRSSYNHEEAAKECGFTCLGSWPGDLKRWQKLGYQHKMTKKNETCRDINLDCKVWRWKSL